MTAHSLQRVLVLGAGYAGLRVVLELVQGCRRHALADTEIVLVDRGRDHELITQLHLVAAAAMDADAARRPIASLLPPNGSRFHRGQVEALDLEEKIVVAGGERLPYDRLVVTLGSEATAPAIPGLQEHAFSLRWWKDAVCLRDHLRRSFLGAATAPGDGRARSLRVAVVGGGATGCQLAGELAHWVPALADEEGIEVEAVQLLLLEANDRLMAGAEEAVSRQAEEVLRRKGVDVRLETSLEKVSANSLTSNGETLPCDTVVWTGGVQAPQFLGAAGLATGPSGRLRVDPYLRSVNAPEVYAAGDAALIEHDGSALPATAGFALRQGAYVATCLLDELLGRPMKAYRPRDVGLLVSLGGGDAVGRVLGVALEGPPAGLVKENIERWYLTTVTRRLPLLDF